MFRNLFSVLAAGAWAVWLATLVLSWNGDDIHNSYHSLGAGAVIVAIVSSAVALFRARG